MMSHAKDDPRIMRGMTAQLAARRARLDDGELPLGWKVGFGAPAVMQKFGTDAPLIGFLMKKALVKSGGTVSLKGWARPVAEPEIAVHMGKDLAAGAKVATIVGSIAALAPAIELVDLDPPPENLEAILGGNIFQRHVVLGRRDETRAGGSTAGLLCRIIRHGAEAARTTDPESATGQLIDIVRHVADLLPAFGEALRAGDVIITGSVVPPIFVQANEDEIAFALDPIGSVEVKFSRT
jgi:2-keto-4-pentenoate hydratase